MAMTNEQLTKWIDEIFGTIDEIKTNSGDITLITRTVTQHGHQIQELQQDLIADTTQETLDNNAPYVSRTSPAIGDRAFESLVGCSFNWNQLINGVNASVFSNYSVTGSDPSFADNVCSFTAGAQSNYVGANIPCTKGHVYFMRCKVKVATATTNVGLIEYRSNKTIYTSATTEWQSLSGIVAYNSDNANGIFMVIDRRTSEWSEIQFTDFILTDLTAMFGSTVADYIASLETATAGSGIAFLKRYGFFTEDYYTYDAGSLQSVNVASKTIKDADDTTIETITYEQNLDLYGLPTIVDEELVYDGNTYKSDGSGTKKYDNVDLGSLTWSYVSGDHSRMVALFDSAKGAAGSEVFKGICSLYTLDSSNNIYAHATDKTISCNGEAIWVYDSVYTDADEFKSAMDGVKLIYELATPTTLSAAPYQDPQLAAPEGTETFTDYLVEQSSRDVSIPVGHETTYIKVPEWLQTGYLADLRYKVEFDIPATLASLDARIYALEHPTTNSTKSTKKK